MKAAPLDKQLCFALYTTTNKITSIYRTLLEPHDLTYTQFVILMLLWEKDGISISQLAKKAQLTKATMTPLLKRMEQKGLIQRQMLSDNERQKSIMLTEQGKQLSDYSLDITERVFCATGLTSDEAATIIRLCNKIDLDQ
jgi:DNA-binding MarR family transcriptional regulator